MIFLLDEDVISFDESKHQQANNFQRGRRLQNAENETGKWSFRDYINAYTFTYNQSTQ